MVGKKLSFAVLGAVLGAAACSTDGDATDNHSDAVGQGAGSGAGGQGGAGASGVAGVGGSSQEGCGVGDVANLLVRPIDDARDCVDAYSPISLGCASPATPSGLLYYFECWQDSSTGQRVVSPVPLENLLVKGNWSKCEGQGETPSWAKTCQKTDCNRHANTMCTFEDTCQQLACGDAWSPYQASSCVRSKGAPCTTSEQCEPTQICSLFQNQNGSRCAYRADGTCFCHKTGAGPTQTGFCAAP